MFSSAAAGVSLVAASLVLVIGVSALIGFRGFKSARETAPSQSVVLRALSGERGAGAAATTPVVIGSKRAATKPSAPRTAKRSSRPARRSSTRRGETRKAPARDGGSAPKRQPAPTAEKPAPAEKPSAPASAPEVVEEKSPPATPVDQVVEDVTTVVEEVPKPVEKSVGDVLLDVRDVLP